MKMYTLISQQVSEHVYLVIILLSFLDEVSVSAGRQGEPHVYVKRTDMKNNNNNTHTMPHKKMFLVQNLKVRLYLCNHYKCMVMDI